MGNFDCSLDDQSREFYPSGLVADRRPPATAPAPRFYRCHRAVWRGACADEINFLLSDRDFCGKIDQRNFLCNSLRVFPVIEAAAGRPSGRRQVIGMPIVIEHN
jgi:hypothetical protein